MELIYQWGKGMVQGKSENMVSQSKTERLEGRV